MVIVYLPAKKISNHKPFSPKDMNHQYSRSLPLIIPWFTATSTESHNRSASYAQLFQQHRWIIDTRFWQIGSILQ